MSGRKTTRRQFLEQAAGAAVSPVATAFLSSAKAQPGVPSRAASTEKPPTSWTRVSEHLALFHGPVNVGILLDGQDKALLIDCGDGRVQELLPSLGVQSVDRILFTHHHRDQACGAGRFTQKGAKLFVPATERPYFEKPELYWQDLKHRWNYYLFHPHRLMLVEGVPVAGECKEDQPIRWGPALIHVLATPGHTDGSVSFLVEVDGRRVIFCGDLMYDHGQLWELYSLQKGFRRGTRQISDYHGFMGAQWELKESLHRLQKATPHLLIPSHGRIIEKPAEAIEAVIRQMDICYDKYVSISALRHYFPELFEEFQGRPGHMPLRPGLPVPDCLRHIGTTWILVSQQKKAALVMDCGHPGIVQTLQEMQAKGELGPIEGLWITHYHNDHVGGVAEFQKTFDCPCIADEHLAAVLTQPMAWRLPCICPDPIRVHRPTKHGESWRWHEYKLTAFYYPGQTLYHDALLVEKDDLKMLFIGDSHTPAGIDDYCAQNRNWLGQNVGFDRCLALLEEIQPTHLFNCHVDLGFHFRPEDIRFMRANLAEREKLFGQLMPWDHPNYGMDESWVRAFPYEQKAKPGQSLSLQVVITNHSAKVQPSAVRVVLPTAWGGGTSHWTQASIPPKAEHGLRLQIPIPASVPPGRYVLPIDVRHGPWDLPQFAETIVQVQ
ncbi:MAG: MBL fold metallo-hydrolase [Thermoguttaceae bacterium]|nr:MBL fold metallo-hydrolase [Thermoguttaceae bacterium]MDW8038174.1 MBL fold metallo-hydrolase [Thermoguttaceae bacterium]